MYKTIEKHTTNCKQYIPVAGGDFNAELGLGHGTECISVARYTLNEGNNRGDWMNYWLMLQGYTALNTMHRKTPQKQTTFVSPIGIGKQIDYILTKRRHLGHNKDAEANDMIHMESDHRCVMATVTITMLGKNNHNKNTCLENACMHDVHVTGPLPPTQHNHKGLALCSRCHLAWASEDTPVGPGKANNGEAVGGPHQRPKGEVHMP